MIGSVMRKRARVQSGSTAAASATVIPPARNEPM
jgi:hypothetical protein